MTQTDYDFIVIGSGIAGLNIALLAQEHGLVLILTKGKIDDCNTRYAQGGIAAAIGPGDSTKLHFQDTLAAGVGLCDPEAVEVLTREGPERVSNLIRWGVAFDTIHGQIALGREGAHSVPRILHAGGDATGQHIEQALTERVTQSSITVMEYTLATRLVVDQGKVTAVEALNAITGEHQTFNSSIVVLATGGAGRLFAYTTNPEVATGDGVALAFRARGPTYGYGVLPVPSHRLLQRGCAGLSAVRSDARRGSGPSGPGRQDLYGRLPSPGRSGAPGRGVPRHRRRDAKNRDQAGLPGHIPPAARPGPGPLPQHIQFSAWVTALILPPSPFRWLPPPIT